MEDFLRYILTFFLIVFCIIPNYAETRFQTCPETDIPLIVSGSVLSGSSIYLLSKIKPLSIDQIKGLKTTDINSFDRLACQYWNPKISNYSDYLLIGSMFAPATLLSSKLIRNDYDTIGLMYFETLLISGALNQLIKAIVKRTRPYAYNFNIPNSYKLNNANMRESFYSGHTAISFTALVFTASLYDHYHANSKYSTYVWGTAIGTATTVGLLRIFSGKHFPTDVIAGALIGGLLGYYIPKLHETKHQVDNKKLSSFNVSISVPL